MFANAELLPTGPFASWVLWLAFIIFLSALSLAGWIHYLTRLPVRITVPGPGEIVRAVSARERSRFLSDIDTVLTSYRAGAASVSQAHLALAAIARALASAATNTNLETATKAVIASKLGAVWPELVALIGACEAPSFAAHAHADVEATAAELVRLVRAATRLADEGSARQ